MPIQKVYADRDYVDSKALENIPIPTTATIGQTVVVKAVDENNKPTEWETTDIDDNRFFYFDAVLNNDLTIITTDTTFEMIEAEINNGKLPVCCAEFMDGKLHLPLVTYFEGTIATFGVSLIDATLQVSINTDGEANVVTTMVDDALSSTSANPVQNKVVNTAISNLQTQVNDIVISIPVKGIHYWTEADKESIVQDVIAAMGMPVFGTVDEENNIILSGELVAGTYTIKYEEANGNKIDIGNIALGVEESIVYEAVVGQPKRDSNSNVVYYDNLSGQTNYKMLYQTTGDVPYCSDAAYAIQTAYYPIAVPNGKSKVVFTFPNLASGKTLIMAIRTMTLSDNKYVQATSSGWLENGVYSWEFGADVQYIAPYFRNTDYSGLDSYDLSGATLTWE